MFGDPKVSASDPPAVEKGLNNQDKTV